jgi:hypothetical protein
MAQTDTLNMDPLGLKKGYIHTFEVPVETNSNDVASVVRRRRGAWCGQYWFRRLLNAMHVSISEFPFSHVFAQTAAWNLIKIAHNVYLISLSR